MRAVIVACEGCAKSKAEVAELRVELELEREGRRKAEAALESTRVELVKLEQLLFGPRSERGQSGQGVKESQGEAEAKSEAQERRGRGQQPGSAGHGRRSYEHLPTRHERHDPPVEGRRCEKCGKPYAVMPSEEQTEIIEMAVESRRVIHHRRRWRRTCGCRKSRAIVTAAAVPKVIPRGRFGEGLMARLLMWKFVWGLPVERMSDMLGQEGLALAPGTLCGLLRKMEPLLAPLAQLILARNAASDHLHADETRWRVLASEAGSKAWWLWVFGGPDTVAFVIKPSRGLAVVAEHLGIDLEQKGKLALPGGRQLVLSSDFYAVYVAAGRRVEGIDNHDCWAHVRRHVRDVGRAHPSCAVWAEGWLRLIGQLSTSTIERGCRQPPAASRSRLPRSRQ
jgi:transposase